MASRKNRSRKANRKSPKWPPDSRERLRQRFDALVAWLACPSLALARRRSAAAVRRQPGRRLLACRATRARRRRAAGARDAGGDEARRAGANRRREYARIEDMPGLPKYTEVEPGQPRATLEEKPRAPSRSSSPRPRRRVPRPGASNAVPFRDLNSRPLVAIVIDDVGLDRPRSKRAWELPGPLTMSFLPYAKDLREQARAARAQGPGADAASADGAQRPQRSRAQCAAGVAERRRAAPAHDSGARQLRRLCRRQQPHGQPLHRLPTRHGDGAAPVQGRAA